MFLAAPTSSVFWISLLVVTNLVAIAACLAILRSRTSRQQRRITLLNATIRDYFRHGGVEVVVASTPIGNGQSFIAFIESEPMKRFRLSHIIEITLREHVAKTCNLQLEKIFWRFPLKDMVPADTATEKQAAKDADSYINEGLVYYRDLPKGDVQEVSWEKFEESSAMHPVDKPDAAPPTHAS